MKEVIREVEMLGSIFTAGLNFDLQDIDEIFRVYSTYNTSETNEILLFANDWLINKIEDCLEECNAKGEVGHFLNSPKTSLSLIPHLSFSRGTYTVHVIEKSIQGDKSLLMASSSMIKPRECIIIDNNYFG